MKNTLTTLAGGLCLILIAAVAQAEIPFDHAIKILKTRESLVKPADLEEAKAALRAQWPRGGAECIRTLMDIWSSSEFTHPASIDLACELADKDTVNIIYAVVAAHSAQHDGNWPYRVDHFFYDLGPVLWEKLGHPEELLTFTLDNGRTIWHLPMSTEASDKFGLERLKLCQRRATEADSCEIGVALSREALPAVADFVQSELKRLGAEPEAIGRQPLRSAVGLLVQWSHPRALPLVTALLDKLPGDARYEKLRTEWQMDVLKLRYQDDLDALLRIAQSERTNPRILTWAAWRYVYAGGSRTKLREALHMNRNVATEGPYAGACITDALLYQMFGEGESSWVRPTDGVTVHNFPIAAAAFSPDLLNGAEYAAYVEEGADAKTPEQSRAFFEKYTYGAALKRASE